MMSAETTSRGISSRPRWVNRDMTSWQIKFGSFCENSNAASLALSIKASEGFSERVGMEAAAGGASGGGSGQGGRVGCVPRFKMGRPLEQGGVLCGCDCPEGGGAEGADCVGCDCGEDAVCACGEIGALRKSARSTSSRHLNLRPQ